MPPKDSSYLIKAFESLVAPHLSRTLGYEVFRRRQHWTKDPKLPKSKNFSSIDPAVLQNIVSVRDSRLFDLVDINRGNERMANGKNSKNANMEKEQVCKTLCIDGGGVRGVLTIQILKRIIERYPTFLDNVHCIFGTSVGGILSLLLASGYSIHETEEIFDFAIPYIFYKNPYRIFNPYRSRYSDKDKEALFKYFFQEITLAELTKLTSVISFRLDGQRSLKNSFFDKEGWRPAVFSNIPKGKSKVEPDLEMKAYEAAMMTSAAPTFFPVRNGYTDGGIVANNPSILALSKILGHFPHINTNSTAILSIGSGAFGRHTNIFSSVSREGEVQYNKKNMNATPVLKHADWGIAQWIPFLLDLILDGDQITTDLVMHHLLNDDMYHRVDPYLPHSVPLDDTTSMVMLKEFGKQVDLTDTFKFVERNFIVDQEFTDDDVFNKADSQSGYTEAWKSSVGK